MRKFLPGFRNFSKSVNGYSKPIKLGNRHLFFVEAACEFGDKVVLIGWCSADAFQLRNPSDDSTWYIVQRQERNDVVNHVRNAGIGDDCSSRPGFVAVYPAGDIPKSVRATADGQGKELKLPVPCSQKDLPAEAQSLLERALKDFGQVAAAPDGLAPDQRDANPGDFARGYIEGVWQSQVDGAAVVFGWAYSNGSEPVVLELENGEPISDDCIFWRRRMDLVSAFPNEVTPNDRTGFIAWIPPQKRQPVVSLVVKDARGAKVLSQSGVTETLPRHPVEASVRLFGLEARLDEFSKRCEIVDARLLAPMLRARSAELLERGGDTETFGKAPSDPVVSIVIPLYRRFDFIEHQIAEFARDPWLQECAEIIYVVDDPNIIEPVRALTRRVFQLFGVAVRLVWNGHNGGYSAANNLGASQARGRAILFMNSDVIPIEPGWLKRMLDTLDRDEGIGAVGAQLRFADGGIQHIGMAHEHDAALGVWWCKHPGAGLDPDLASPRGVTEVTALTGACLLVRRTAFDRAGGWDTGYLIGDFEDSDLCLTLREHGFRLVLEPSAVLVHLERQSVVSIGEDTFRLRVTLLNAARHYSRWKDAITGKETVEALR